MNTIQMQESVPPGTGEIDLSPCGGQAIPVSGHDRGNWIHLAAVIDQAGPLLTARVQQGFGQAGV